MSRGFLKKNIKSSSEEERQLLLGDHELALDVALCDAGMLFRVDLTEDASVESLLRRLAGSRNPQLSFDD